jgi:signal transduction histidine kinase
VPDPEHIQALPDQLAWKLDRAADLGASADDAAAEPVPQLSFRMLPVSGVPVRAPMGLQPGGAGPAAPPMPDLAKLAHELRTPLGAIVALSEVMRDEQFGALGNPRYKGYANDIHQSARHALAVLTAMLDADPVQDGRADPRGRMTFEAVELNALARGCVSGLQPVAANARVNLRTALNPRPLPLIADRRSIKQIVLNLLANALKFTPAGGTITVATSIRAGAQAGDQAGSHSPGGVRIDVRDTGCGMTGALIAEVLGRSIDSTSDAAGTGVGLPLAQALAEANGGHITITSQPGSGTTVSLHLPGIAPATR